MREDVSRMSDREFRAYKRMLRRRREQRRRLITFIATVCLVGVCVISYHSLKSSANNGSDKIALKYYTSVTVKSGETLWGIAEEYIDYSQYKNKEQYIKEICSINNLEDSSAIRIGQRIVVPYFSEEFKK